LFSHWNPINEPLITAPSNKQLIILSSRSTVGVYNQIDKLVYELYELTEEEIAIVKEQ
jgi:hypothetical protein